MTPNEFQAQCLKRWQVLQPAPLHEQERVLLALSVCGEAGELANLIKKAQYGQPVSHSDIESELGDIFFYLSVLTKRYGLTLDAVMQANVDKLSARHGDQFDPSYYNGDGPGGALVSVPKYEPAPVSAEGRLYRDFD